MKKRSTNFHLQTEEDKEVFYSMEHITESQYELIRKDDSDNHSHRENYYDLEMKQHQVILERNDVKPSKFCGMCEQTSTSKSKDDESSCKLI